MFVSTQLLQNSLAFVIGAAILSFALAPAFIWLLYKLNITRRGEHDFTLQGQKAEKIGTPIMGGLLVIVTVVVITILFNWERKYTYVPIGAMVLAALLGAADDLLNIFGGERRLRPLAQTLTLIKVHRLWYMRLWHALTLPWIAFRHTAQVLGSKDPGRGVQVHEKLILQFIAGAVTAWWVYVKLGVSWHSIWVPFWGQLHIGWLIIPIIILAVMFTANAVNVADGLDGLAGGSLIITFIGLTLLSWVEGRTAFAPLNATVVGALITYTYFNVKPARFQMGDVGSLGLGTLLAINAIAINHILLLPFLGFIFYIEIISVIIQLVYRRLLGRRFFRMAPLHHHFELKGWNEEKIVMRFWIVQGFMVILGVWISLIK